MITLRSKNHSCADLKAALREHKGKRAIVRLGSRTHTNNIIKKGSKRPFVEVNTVAAVEVSRKKLSMKAAFKEHEVRQAEWFKINRRQRATDPFSFTDCLSNESVSVENMPYPVLAKRDFGFKGIGMVLINNAEEMNAFMSNPIKVLAEIQIAKNAAERAKIEKELVENPDMEPRTVPNDPTFPEEMSASAASMAVHGYYFERFYSYEREYRLHVTADGCFMAWRKLRRRDANDRHYFNSSNCNWAGVDNDLFDRPKCWDAMVEHAVRSLVSCGLDIGAADVRVQTNKDNDDPQFIVCEINSAPALGESGNKAYYDAIVGIVEKKFENLKKK